VGSVELLAHEEGYAQGSRFFGFSDRERLTFSVQVDRGMDPGYAEFNSASLAWYLEWRMMPEGLYAVGAEPPTNGFKTVPELIQGGYPVMMEPGEERTYQLEFGVLAGGEAIDAFAASLPSVNAEGA
jgi:hypothetical protein